jgi:integrase
LTDRAIKAWPAASDGKRYLVWDAAQPCLAVRVTSTGAKSFVVIRRRPGDRYPVTAVLGSYPTISLKRAREDASDALKLIVSGKSPGEARAEERRAQARKRADRFGIAAEAFLDDLRREGLRSFPDVEGPLRREFLGQACKVVVDDDGKRITKWEDRRDPVWRDRPIAGIKRGDIIERLDLIKRRSRKHAARHALAAVRRFFGWCVEGERFGIEVNPCAGIKDKTIGVRGKDLKRQRVLNDAELRDVWQAAGELGYPFGSVVRLLMILGQRLNDVAEARHSEIALDAAILVVPPERYKTNTAQEVPLPPLAVEILRAVPRFTGPFVFTTTAGQRPVSLGSKAKGYIDAKVAERRRERGDEPMPAWVFHDLRRSVRTRLVSDLGVDAFIAERVIGHTLPGLHGVYDQGTHRTQKRDALARWAEALAAIVEPPPVQPGKILQMQGRR